MRLARLAARRTRGLAVVRQKVAGARGKETAGALAGIGVALRRGRTARPALGTAVTLASAVVRPSRLVGAVVAGANPLRRARRPCDGAARRRAGLRNANARPT